MSFFRGPFRLGEDSPHEVDAPSREGWERVRCLLCGAVSHRHVLKARDLANEGTEWFRLVRCRDCGFLFQNPRPSKDRIWSYYPPSYPEHNISSSIPAEASTPRGALRKFWAAYTARLRPELLADLLRARRGRLLDVGCGSGFTLWQAAGLGWEPYGVDPSHQAVAFARERGIKGFVGELTDAHFDSDFFDLVCINHVLEHVHEPDATVAEIRRVTKPNGRLFVGVPNGKALCLSLLGQYWRGLELPRHLYYFRAEDLARLIGRHGFRLVNIGYHTAPEDFLVSLNYCLRHCLGLRWPILRKNPVWSLVMFHADILSRLLGRADRLEMVFEPA